LPKLETYKPGLLFYSLIADGIFGALDSLELHITSREDLNQLMLYSWPLKSLKINLNFFSKEDCDLNLLFGSVSQFSNTLQNFMIELAGNEWEDEFDNPILVNRLELPHLKTFKMYHKNMHARNIDFLVSCTKLEYIDLKLKRNVCREPNGRYYPNAALKQKQMRSCSSFDDQQEIIKFREYYATMYDSNVWQVLPKLQALSVEANTPYEHCARTYLYEKFGFTQPEWDLHQKLAAK